MDAQTNGQRSSTYVNTPMEDGIGCHKYVMCRRFVIEIDDFPLLCDAFNKLISKLHQYIMIFHFLCA